MLMDSNSKLDWQKLRDQIKTFGIRNSNVMAIAPTATISNICGVSQSIEPTYSNLFVKSNLSGEFTIVNPYLVADLKKLGLWDKAIVHELKYYDGSLKPIDKIPQAIKDKYATAFEIDPSWLIRSASKRQKWIDQSQSLNLYINQPSGKKLDQLYKMAWSYGLKTTYYLRSLAATGTEKSTIADGKLNAVSDSKICSINNQDECESCQ
jgi:ribonucleoside-diphosphate reductase alpha chain